MEETDMKKYLSGIYYDTKNPASYGGIDKLYKYSKKDGKNISKNFIKNWLTSQTVYTRNKAVRRNYKRLRVVVPMKHYQYDADTISMIRYKKSNKFKFILVVIDILSRFAWTIPLESLQGKEMVSALKNLLIINPQKFRTDAGSEFVNANVKQYLSIHNIDHIITRNETKANFAERFIKTLKSKIVKSMQHGRTFKWDSILENATRSYNNSYHRSIKMTPNEALKKNDSELWKMQYNDLCSDSSIKKNSQKDKKSSIKIGDHVKLSHLKLPFLKEYEERWTGEFFTIIERKVKQGIAQYKLKDWNNIIIEGSFYENELQKIDTKDAVYEIDKILKKRTRNGKKEVFVSWINWNKKFNSWIPASDVIKLKGGTQ